MDEYRLNKFGNNDDGFTIFATHPAAQGTRIVYAHRDGNVTQVDVVLWGVLFDGTAVPITTCGVWDGSGNKNKFVLHPSGSCSEYDQSWNSVEAAIEEVRLRDEDKV